MVDASFHPVEGGGVLFDASRGRIYALNATAGFTWLCIRDGLSRHQTTQAIAEAFGVDETVAAGWCRDSFEIFNDRGLLASGRRQDNRPRADEPISAPTPAPEVREATGITTERAEYRLFGMPLSVGAPEDFRQDIDSFLGGLRASESDPVKNRLPTVAIDVVPYGGEWTIAIDGRVEARCGRQGVVAEIERLLVQTVVPRMPHLLTFHAAVAERDSRSFLLAGESGAGKTTLCVALGQSGWRFGSDEIVLLTDASGLRALPFPACIKKDAFPVVETWFPALRLAPEHQRYGKTVKYLPMRCQTEMAGTGYVIFPHYDPASEAGLRSLESFDGLQRLLEHCVFVPEGFQHADVDGLLDWHGRQRYFDLHFASCDGAIALLRNIGAVAADKN